MQDPAGPAGPAGQGPCSELGVFFVVFSAHEWEDIPARGRACLFLSPRFEALPEVGQMDRQHAG